jgi:hypothetical protein
MTRSRLSRFRTAADIRFENERLPGRGSTRLSERIGAGTTLGGVASVRVHILALAIVIAGLAAPFVMLSMQHDFALLFLSQPVALDPLDLP